jgi:hypothetical protein
MKPHNWLYAVSEFSALYTIMLFKFGNLLIAYLSLLSTVVSFFVSFVMERWVKKKTALVAEQEGPENAAQEPTS